VIRSNLMKSAVLVVAVSLAACAQGTSSDDDDDGSDPIDAPITTDDAPPPTIDAPPIDSPPPPIDAPIDAPITGNADTCAMAIDITAAAMLPNGTTLTGDLTGFTNDIQPDPTGCTGFINDGPDAIYTLTNIPAGRIITATVDAPAWDSSIEIVQPCAFTPTCLAGRDAGNPETISYTTTTAGTYHVIVDSWDVASYGPYTLTVRVQ
jgi:hypothetical protein